MKIYWNNAYKKEISRPHPKNKVRIQRSSKCSPSNSPTNLFLCLIQHIQEAIKRTGLHITTVFHTISYGTLIQIKRIFRRKKFYGLNQSSNFLRNVLAKEMMKERQFNLKEKDNPSVLEDYISSKKDQSIFTSIVTQLVEQ